MGGEREASYVRVCCGVKISWCKLVLTGIYRVCFVISLSGGSDN